MANKLPVNTCPDNSRPENFQCFGPVAQNDTEFNGFNMADLGCFSQDGKDSNKYYHASVVQNRQSRKWYLYIEFGRVGAQKPSFQFTEADSQQEAQRLFVRQCDEKNSKRGQWEVVGSQKLFMPRRKGNGSTEDLYAVRRLAARAYGLPDAKDISSAAKPIVKAAPTAAKKSFRCDPQSTQLVRDLLGGAIAYTRTNIVGGTIPTAEAIAMARDLLQDALNRIGRTGDDLKVQVQDRELREITRALYSRIPKVKPPFSPEEDWVLSQNNIEGWEQDLDTFESALKSGSFSESLEDDPLERLPIDLQWLDTKSDKGVWVRDWIQSATRDRHAYLPAKMQIHHVWEIQQHVEKDRILPVQDELVRTRSLTPSTHRPLHQIKIRPDLSKEENARCLRTNTALLFHGTRSVNVAGIFQSSLRLPKNLAGVVTHGAAFGQGIYFADDWKKSAGYTSLESACWNRRGANS